MPDPWPFRRLFDLWHAAGRVDADGGPLRWSDLSGFAQLHQLDSDETCVLRAMSEEYLQGLRLTNRLHLSPMENAND